MSKYIDGTWLLNFFVDIPDDYTLTIGNLRAIVSDAPTAECFTCGMERVKDEKHGSLPTLVYNPEDVSDEVLEANDRLVRLADVCKLIKREWQINPHQWGELARLPSTDIVRCRECKHWIDDRKSEADMGTCGSTHYFTNTDDFCSYGVQIDECEKEYRELEEIADTPQTESTGSPIGDYRDGVGAWQTDCDDRYAVRTDSGEVVAHACPLGCDQSDCPWK